MKKGNEKHYLKIYAIYDLNEQIVFIGNIKECSDYLEVNVMSAYRASSGGHRIKRKYYISSVGEKDFFSDDTKVCSKCGKRKSLSDFSKYRKSYRHICKDCFNKYQRDRRKKKKKTRRNNRRY